MTACRKSAAKSDGAEERKPSIKCKTGKEAKGKLAVKSNGTEKPKTHDLSDVTRGLAVMSIAQEKSEYEKRAMFLYRDELYMEDFKSVYDKESLYAIYNKADENWKFFKDSDKAPYLAMARVHKVAIAEIKKTLELTDVMMNLKM